MSAEPSQRVKKATKATTKPAKRAAGAAKPSRMAKVLPLSLRTKIKLLLARLWAKLKTWRLRRRARNI